MTCGIDLVTLPTSLDGYTAVVVLRRQIIMTRGMVKHLGWLWLECARNSVVFVCVLPMPDIKSYTARETADVARRSLVRHYPIKPSLCKCYNADCD